MYCQSIWHEWHSRPKQIKSARRQESHSGGAASPYCSQLYIGLNQIMQSCTTLPLQSNSLCRLNYSVDSMLCIKFILLNWHWCYPPPLLNLLGQCYCCFCCPARMIIYYYRTTGKAQNESIESLLEELQIFWQCFDLLQSLETVNSACWCAVRGHQVQQLFDGQATCKLSSLCSISWNELSGYLLLIEKRMACVQFCKTMEIMWGKSMLEPSN